MKIIEKINRLLEEDKNQKTKQTWYSYEYFPPKTAAGKFYF